MKNQRLLEGARPAARRRSHVPSDLKSTVLEGLKSRFGQLAKLSDSLSLYDVGDCALRIYFRYSKIHGKNRAFYGLRLEDLRRLEGHPAVICFLWDGQAQPLFVPYSEYEEIFHGLTPASDGQYKVQVCLSEEGTELYVARAGRFNVEGCLGWEAVTSLVDSTRLQNVPDLSHSQVQTILGAIGAAKAFDVWVPPTDRPGLDWTYAAQYECCAALPSRFDKVSSILQEVDVVWLERGSGELRALFEVEHSTPVYSGLLRFNDIYLVDQRLGSTFSIVAAADRRSLFVRQLQRPTFRMSGLADLCTFLEYRSVYSWHMRIASGSG